MKIEKQAVIVIHGIGEQKPMDTLRSFVNNLKAYLLELDESEYKTIIRSKPDGVSDIYETRRLSLTKTRNRPTTDFYEFYWAHNMRESKFTDIYSWLKRIFLSKKGKVPKRLLGFWIKTWIIAVLVAVIIAIVILKVEANKLKSIIGTIVALPFILSFVKTTILNSLGDAGRYFNPAPSNVAERNNIRQQGLRFLKKLHEIEGAVAYDRIIVVGHSLGSVIAYDLLRLLWTEYNAQHGNVLEIDQSAISEMEMVLAKKQLGNINVFQDLQYKCWSQQRNIGQKWLVSDFITIGSPLCNSDYLIAQNVAFEEMKNQYEFPTCPPMVDEKKRIHYPSDTYEVDNQKRTVKILHHAALFAVCRWTNIYFSSDFIGGPMKRLFGDAIKDQEIKRKGFWFYPSGHTKYWDIKNKQALRKIALALHLRDQ